MSKASGGRDGTTGGDSPSIPGSPDEALALAVRISRAAVTGALSKSQPPASYSVGFEEAFRELAAREGGYLRDPSIPASDLAFGDIAFDPPLLPAEQARDLYWRFCWAPALCDDLPRPIALEVFDMAAFSGADAALRALQSALRLPAGRLPHAELILEIRRSDPVRLRARFLIARLSDIAERLRSP